MNYAVIKCTNGNFKIESEWANDNKKGARVDWRNKCNSLDNDSNFHGTAVIEVVDANMNVVDDMRYFINVPAPESAEE